MRAFILALVVLSLSLVQACKVNYSLSGASTGTAETLSIQFFKNNAPLNNPLLSQVFTEKMKDKFNRETKLKLVDENGDMQLSGQITDYNVAPVAIQQNVSAARNRLTITIQVKFVNKTNPRFDFDKSFSNFEDFDANVSLASVESELVNTICDKIVQQIFNEAVINW